MTIQSFDAASAYARTMARPGLGGDVKTPATEASPFTSMVEGVLNNAVQSTQKSEAMAAQAVVGKADLVDVVASVNSAEMAMETLVTVRDRVINAYQDIMRMPI